MKTLTILIGLPGSGKSTWRAKHQKDEVVISLDDILEDLAKKDGISYPEAFNKYAAFAGKKAEILFKQAINKEQDIIIDKTNMSIKNRSTYLKAAKDYKEKIAVIFTLPEPELKTRLQKRAEITGKIIPDSVIEDMARRYDEPSKAEGFTKIVRVR